LVADETTNGTHDAVYVDLSVDGAFETRLTGSNGFGCFSPIVTSDWVIGPGAFVR
jgi:hypothetical protein